MKRIVAIVVLILLLMSVSSFPFNFQPVKAEYLSDGEERSEIYPQPACEGTSEEDQECSSRRKVADDSRDHSRLGGAARSCCSHYDSVTRKISLTYYFPEPKIEESRIFASHEGEDSYVSVIMDGLPQHEVASLPVLPFKTGKILLPFGTQFECVRVVGGRKRQVSGAYLVEYGQEPVRLSAVESTAASVATLPNKAVYGSSKQFPARLYSDVSVQSKMGYRLLLLNLYPVEYSPSTRKLFYYEDATVEVKVLPVTTGEPSTFSGYSQRREIVEGLIDNSEVIKTYPTTEQTPTYQYVIITNEQLNGTLGPYNFQALRDDKISRGIPATIVTVEWIYANYDGARPDGGQDSQTKIRNFIIDAFNNWGTMYVLLGGDGDGGDVGGESGDVIIPHRGFASVSGEIDYDIPADMYYSCLNGTFDYDGDGVYGEPNDGPSGGEVDLFAEVYVGRACTDSEEEVQNFVRKTLSYQNSTSYDLRKVWMVGEYLGFGGVADWGGNYKDEIKEGSDAHGYTTVGFENSIYASRFDAVTLYDRDYPGNDWPRSELIATINDGVHLINHLGHATVDYAMKMYNPDVDALTNDELYFIGYSQGCYCGSFDDRTTSPGSYTSVDCISEHFTTEAHGAVAFISNSRYGWGTWNTDGPSQHYDREFWDAVLGENMFNVGVANQDSKEDNAGRVGSWVERYCYYEINLFGDPELRIILPPAYEHELNVNVDAPNYLKPGDSSVLNATVCNMGLNNETDVELFLLINGTEVRNITISELMNGTCYTFDYLWVPTVEATYNVTVYAPPVADENVTENNGLTKFVTVTDAAMIGIIVAHGETLHSEELADYYTSLGYIVEKITTTITLGVLSNYDIVIVGEWGGTWAPSEIAAVQTYIDSGRGFVTIGDQLDIHVQEILGTYGISYTGISAPGGSSSYFDPFHPIMRDVNFIYASSPVNSLQITAPAYWIANDMSDTYTLIAGAEVGGYVLCLSNDFASDVYYDDNEIMFKNIVEWMPVKYEHELVVYVDAPIFLEPGDSSTLNATVCNHGLSNETGVELFLLIDGTEVKNATISELMNGTCYMLDYLWTPIAEAVYNVTAYTLPVPDENVTRNNVATKMVDVRPIAGYVLFDQTHWTDDISQYSICVESLTHRGYVVDSLTTSPITPSALAGYDILVIPQAQDYYSSGELAVIQDFVLSGGGLLVIGDDEPYVYTDLTGFAGIAWISGGASGVTCDITPHEVTECVTCVYLDVPIAEMLTTAPAVDLVRDPSGGIMLAASHQFCSGRVIGFADEGSLQNYGIIEQDNLRLANNMIDWLVVVKYEHELVVYLDTPTFPEPDNPSLLNATVCNCGLVNETDVELILFINGTEVKSVTIPELARDTCNTTAYLWIPPVESMYNLTAYAVPVPGENVTANNAATRYVLVRVIPDVLIVNDDDGGSFIKGTSLRQFESALSVAGYDYWVWNESSMANPSLNFLTKFSLVIWTCGDYWNWAVDPTDAATLESYLTQGGNILLEGEDIGYDHGGDSFMVNVAHAIMQDDLTGAAGLTVTAPSQTVTFGLPTSFLWLTYPPYDDGVSPTNGGAEIIKYTGTIWTAVTIFEGASNGSVVYCAFPLYCLAQTHGETLATNSINWLLNARDVATYNVTAHPPKVDVGQAVNINVTVGNEGETAENFTVRVYYGNASEYSSSAVFPTGIETEPHSANAMWVEPSFTDLTDYSVGQRFNITIWINLDEPSFLWQFNIVYDKTILGATGCGYTANVQSQFFEGLPTLPITPLFLEINPTHACVIHGETLLGVVEREPGYGSLSWIEFEIISKPTGPHEGHLQFGMFPMETFVMNFELDEIPVTLYHGVYGFGISTPSPWLVGEQEICLLPKSNITLIFTWNTTRVSSGNYTLMAVAGPVPGERDVEDNVFVDGIVEVLCRHDLVIVKVLPFRSWVYEGHTVDFNVTISNQGEFSENVTIILYYNLSEGSAIGVGIIENLEPDENGTILLTWDTVGVMVCRNYTITAVATIPLECDVLDNALESLWTVRVRMLGDTNGDNKVDMKDIARISAAFGSHPGLPRWNPDADLRKDDKIDMWDIALAARDFGRCP